MIHKHNICVLQSQELKRISNFPQQTLNRFSESGFWSYLVKDRIVGGVDLVAAVAVADDEEVVEAAGHQLALGPDSMEKII